MMRARRSRGARGTSLPIRLDISLVCMCILLTSKIGTVLFLSSAQSGRSIRGSATSSLTAPMPATSSRTPCPNSAPGPLKSSNDPIPRKASRFCRVDGLSRERSHGSIDAAGSPRTSRPPSQAPLHGSSSPISAALPDGSQGLESNHVFMSQTLRAHPDMLTLYRLCNDHRIGLVESAAPGNAHYRLSGLPFFSEDAPSLVQGP